MEHSTERSIERVIEAMKQNLGEQLTIDDMARIAMFSKFHFSRIFRDTTGVSPGRFLSALRLQEAKNLLTETSLRIAEISNRVGYSSVGTFSSRFKINVGVAPSVYRATGGITPPPMARHRPRDAEKAAAVVQGEISAPDGRPDAPAFVGLFPGVIPQGQPIRCAMLPSPGPYELENVPQGTWHVLVYSPAPEVAAGCTDVSAAELAPAIGANGPVVIRPGTVVRSADVQLRSAGPLDPPILVAPLISPLSTAANAS